MRAKAALYSNTFGSTGHDATLCGHPGGGSISHSDFTRRRRGLRPSYGWGGTIAPAGRAPERLPNRNCISMLSAGPRRSPEPAHASLGPPQWTWQSLAALRNRSSACLVLPVRRKLYFTEQQSFLAIGAARHGNSLQSSNCQILWWFN
jgi:hypothetical protein